MALSAIPIGFSGMRVASARLSASASNIANIATTGAVPGTVAAASSQVYQPVDVVAFERRSGAQPAGADYNIRQNADGYFTAYDPSSPHADAGGMIAVPNIDLAADIVESLQARMQFQASAAIVRAANEAEKSAIDILA